MSVYGEKKKAVSCSGAFLLFTSTHVKMVHASSDRDSSTTERALLSFVYLKDNKKPTTSPFLHIAFTGCLSSSIALHGANVQITFSKVLTDFGRMQMTNGTFHIPRTGSYMISLRANPPSGTDSIRFDLLVNDQIMWGPYSEDGTPSGQTVPLFLHSGNVLEVMSSTGKTVEVGSRFSVAFLRP